MKIRTQVWTIILAALAALVVISGTALFSLNQTLEQERKAQIDQLLRFANGVVSHYQTLENAARASVHKLDQLAQELQATATHFKVD